MIKRTLLFGNPVYLSTEQDQLKVNYHEFASQKTPFNSIPIEDIGVFILDHPQITISHALIARLLENNVALVTCDARHMPTGLMLNLEGHTLQRQRFEHQLTASEPLKKQLWQQTVRAKILNQAAVLEDGAQEAEKFRRWAGEVRSGDPDNLEARAAAAYWPIIFRGRPDFVRDRGGAMPNNLLNYGYAILRAVTARSLVGSGLLPTWGIFHRNQYNAYCLADDIMEPFRPVVDRHVRRMLEDGEFGDELTPELKRRLLVIPAMDIILEGETSPLMVGMQRTTASLARCFAGESRKLIYPEL